MNESSPDPASENTPHISSPWIVDTSDATFEDDVLRRSTEVPVVVDFWATWCAPCRMLGPVLEKLAVEADGKFILVKADTEQTPQAATAFGVRSIPAVFALRDGRVVDSFMGVVDEPGLRKWLAAIQPSPAEQLLVEGKVLAATDPAAAIEKLRAALNEDADLEPAHIALASALLDQGDLEGAAAEVKWLEARGYMEPEAEEVQARLRLAQSKSASGGVAESQAALEADPSNLSLKVKLAQALAAEEQFEEALTLALDVVEEDFGDQREAARKLMVDIFQLLGADSSLATSYRKKLSAALF